jgi:hypothetical protein
MQRESSLQHRRQLLTHALPGLGLVMIGLGFVFSGIDSPLGGDIIPIFGIFLGVYYAYAFVLDALGSTIWEITGPIERADKRTWIPSRGISISTTYHFGVENMEVWTKDTTLAESLIPGRIYRVHYGKRSKLILEFVVVGSANT